MGFEILTSSSHHLMTSARYLDFVLIQLAHSRQKTTSIEVDVSLYCLLEDDLQRQRLAVPTL
jgi:hypothetical protein